MQPPTQFAHLTQRGQPVRVEYQWLEHAAGEGSPTVVFLHEGLGSVAMWRDFPARLCQRLGARGLVYSRPGYGQSTPRAAGEAWAPDFMHLQAREVLPALLAALGVDPARDNLWLFGHSDGASIALLYAALHPHPHPMAPQGAIVLAPHIFVEDLSVRSIAQARTAYETTDLRQRLARYHADVDSAFGGWNGIWLDPAFRAWNIERELEAIRCPVLAIQGLDDEYGTLAQIDGIASRVPGTRLLKLPRCGHSPHKDQPQAVMDAAAGFIHHNHAINN